MNDDREITTVLDRLVDPFDEEIGDWGAVVDRAAAGRQTVVPRRRLLVATIAPAVVLGALLVTTPWRGGPNVVERAAAALAAPASAGVLHERVVVHETPTMPPPAIRRLVHGRWPRTWVAHADIWLNGASPHGFRIAMSARGRDANGTLIRPPASEVAGTLGADQGLGYDQASRALDPIAFRLPVRQADVDPAAFVKEALTTGHARAEGRATVDGRRTLRIRVTARVYGEVQAIALYYVDAKTYGPVRIVLDHVRPQGDRLLGAPFTSLTLTQLATLPGFAGRYVFDFDRYESLAPTAANRAMTDIRAQHPKAHIV